MFLRSFRQKVVGEWGRESSVPVWRTTGLPRPQPELAFEEIFKEGLGFSPELFNGEMAGAQTGWGWGAVGLIVC